MCLRLCAKFEVALQVLNDTRLHHRHWCIYLSVSPFLPQLATLHANVPRNNLPPLTCLFVTFANNFVLWSDTSSGCLWHLTCLLSTDCQSSVNAYWTYDNRIVTFLVLWAEVKVQQTYDITLYLPSAISSQILETVEDIYFKCCMRPPPKALKKEKLHFQFPFFLNL